MSTVNIRTRTRRRKYAGTSIAVNAFFMIINGVIGYVGWTYILGM